MLLDSVILFTKDRREFTWLESVCAPNYKVVRARGAPGVYGKYRDTR
jgi:hypothetical protein